MTHVEAQRFLSEHCAHWFGSDPQTPLYQAGVLLLMGANHRKHLDDLTQATYYDRAFVQMCLKNLRSNGVWHGDSRETWADWTMNPTTLVLDAMIALGLVARANKKGPLPVRPNRESSACVYVKGPLGAR